MKSKRSSRSPKRSSSKLDAKYTKSAKHTMGSTSKSQTRSRTRSSTSSVDSRRLDHDALSIYIGNVDYSAHEEELRDMFVGCGDIVRVTIIKNMRTGQPKGAAFIEFTDKEAIEAALILNGKELKGRPLLVTEKKPRPDNRRPRSPRSMSSRFNNFNNNNNNSLRSNMYHDYRNQHHPPAYHHHRVMNDRPPPYYTSRSSDMAIAYALPPPQSQSRRYMPSMSTRYDPYRSSNDRPTSHDSYYDPYMLPPPPSHMYHQQHHHHHQNSNKIPSNRASSSSSSSRYNPYVASSASSYRR